MAKIRIKGDTSGYIDIAAPAEAGTQTLTLPTSGSLLSSEDVLDSDQIGTGAVTAAKLDVGQIGGRRNLIINGAMQVAQRGTSFTANGYTVDRFRVNLNGDEYAGTITQESDSPDGFSKSLKIQTTTAETAFQTEDSVDIEQRIEAQDLQQLSWGTSNAKALTLSFWCKCNKTGTQSIHVRAHDASDGYSTGYAINAANTWEYKTVTISGNTTGSITNDNGIGIWIRWQLADGDTASVEDAWDTVNNGPYAVSGAMEWGTSTNDYFQITGVQLEVGTVATPFEHRSYGEELALCQRYFTAFKSTSSGTAFASAFADNSSSFILNLTLPSAMRATPTVTELGDMQIRSNSSDASITAIDGVLLDQTHTYIDVRGDANHGVSRGNGIRMRSNSTGSGFSFDAEL